MPPRPDAIILDEYPYPLARSYQRAARSTRDDSLIHDYLMDLYEMTVKYLAIVVMAQYTNDPDAVDERISQSLQGLVRPSLGMWVGWLRDIIRYYDKQQKPLLVSELTAFYSMKLRFDNKKGKEEQEPLVVCFTKIKEVLNEQMGKGDGTVPTVFTIADFFDAMLQYRNGLAHGTNLGANQKKERVNFMLPGFEALLLKMNFLVRYRLIYVNSVNRAASREKKYEHYYTELYGDSIAPARDPKIMTNDDALPETLYVCNADREYDPILSLRPFIIFRLCNRDGTEQTFVLNEGKEKELTYLSYQCGHAFKLTEYVDDLNALISGVSGGGLIGEVHESSPAVPHSQPVQESQPASSPAAPTEREPTPTAQPPQPQQPSQPQQGGYPQPQPQQQPLPQQGGYPPQQPSQPQPQQQQQPQVICPNCRTVNPANRKFCANCGYPLAGQPGPQPQPQQPNRPAQGYSQPQPAAVICPVCRTANTPGRKFCANCGTRLG